MITYYIGLGSNLGNREAHLSDALKALSKEGRVLQCSRFYETAPCGFASSNWFLNAVCCFETVLQPLDLLHLTQEMERELGRTEKSSCGRYEDRIIDIDLLYAEGYEFQSEELTLPHKELSARSFVLEPWNEISPHLRLPHYDKTVQELLQNLNAPSIRLLTKADKVSLRAINRLLAQLSSSSCDLSMNQLKDLLEKPQVKVCVLEEKSGGIVGMASLCLMISPTGMKGWVEDVVVDYEKRGKGYGKMLMLYVMKMANELGMRNLNLTSRPKRKAANRLYKSIGFQERETNVYRCDLSELPYAKSRK